MLIRFLHKFPNGLLHYFFFTILESKSVIKFPVTKWLPLVLSTLNFSVAIGELSTLLSLEVQS